MINWFKNLLKEAKPSEKVVAEPIIKVTAKKYIATGNASVAEALLTTISASVTAVGTATLSLLKIVPTPSTVKYKAIKIMRSVGKLGKR